MTKKLRRREILIFGASAAGSLLLKSCTPPNATTNSPSPSAPPTASSPAPTAGDGIKVGILHSSSGTMAISENSVIDAEKLAIDEINQAGGVLGKQIIPIVEDGASDPNIFNEKAKKLIDQRQGSNCIWLLDFFQSQGCLRNFQEQKTYALVPRPV